MFRSKSSARKVVMGDESGPMVAIRSYVPDTEVSWPVLALGPMQLAGLADLIARSTALGLSGVGHSGGTYLVTFAPHIARQLADGTVHMMRSSEAGLRAVAVDQAGKIVGQASLTPAQFHPGLIASLWTVASVVAAQYSLKTIETRLGFIERGIADIKQWLEAAEIATLRSHIHYLRDLRAAMQRGTLTAAEYDSALIHIDHIGRDCDRLRILFEGPLAAQQQRLQTYDLNGVFSIGDTLFAFRKELNVYSRLTDLWFIIAWTTLEACWLRASLPVAADFTDQRIQRLKENSTTWLVEQTTFFDALTDRYMRLTTYVERWLRLGSNDRARTILRQIITKRSRQLTRKGQRLLETLSNLEGHSRLLSLDDEHLLDLVVTIGEDGQIQAVHHYTADSQRR
jgi:hypothetical protein